MVRWTIAGLIRWIPKAIVPTIVISLAAIFWSQNHSSLSPSGFLTVSTEAELEQEFPDRTTGDDSGFDRGTDTTVPQSTIPIARKLVLTQQSGFFFANRGHCCEFYAEIPQFLAKTPFTRQLNNLLLEESREYANEFSSVDWATVLESLRDPQPYLQKWDCSFGIGITHASPLSVSLLETRAEYTGGAHGNYFLRGRSFVDDRGTVKELKLKDLFTENSEWKHRLISFCVSNLRCQGASSISDFCVENIEECSFSEDDLSSFTLSSTGIRFYFSPYHVGCYAEGTYSVFCPYETMRECITSESPIVRFMTGDSQTRPERLKSASTGVERQ